MFDNVLNHAIHIPLRFPRFLANNSLITHGQNALAVYKQR